jgi:hypothetical protein
VSNDESPYFAADIQSSQTRSETAWLRCHPVAPFAERGKSHAPSDHLRHFVATPTIRSPRKYDTLNAFSRAPARSYIVAFREQANIREVFSMARHQISAYFVFAALLTLLFPVARAETGPKVIEQVDFGISCGPTSQQEFKHAVWTLHSF